VILKKYILVWLIFGIILNATTINLTNKEKQYIKTKKIITVHNETNWAPYNFNENGVAKGFMVDYIKLLSKKTGLKLKFVSGYSWSEFLDLIKEHKIDVIINIAKTQEREKYINFTTPFIESKKAIFSNIPNLKTIADLEGKVVAVPKDFFIHEYLKKYYPNIKLKLYKDIKEALYGVINQEADALIENYAVVNYQIIKSGLSIKYIAITDDYELKTKISLGIDKNEPLLQSILQKAQDSVTKDEFERLENKWFGLINKIVLKNKGIVIYDSILTPNYTKVEKKIIDRTKILKACVGPTWKPFEIIENGQYSGLIADYADLISSKIGIEFEIKPMKSFKQSIEELKNNNCDVILADVATPANKRMFYVTKPYYVSPRAFVTHKDTPWVSDFAYLLKYNKKVGVVANTPAKKVLEKLYKNNIEIVEFQSTKDGLKAVSAKKIIAFVNIMPTIAYAMQENLFADIKIAGYLKDNIPLSVIINDNDFPFVAIFNKAINSITEKEKLDIFEKWVTVKFEKKIDYQYLWEVIFFSLCIVGLVLYINYHLKRKVDKEVEKNKQHQLIMLQQSRLAQMGEMISMIAHQWRQPLNSLALLNQSIVLKYNRNKLDSDFIEYFKNNTQKLINGMSTTIDDFRDFFKPQKAKQEFIVNDVVNHTLQMIEPIFVANNIKVDINSSENITIVGYPNELGQALLNIINNAKDALIQNDIENKHIIITLRSKVEYIILSVEDNAGGIPNNIKDKIFDPYFSTKENKNGTGLGLYMTKIIVQEHLGGKLYVNNTEDGAIFTIQI